MTYDDAKFIIDERTYWEDQGCGCPSGNPPCSKCVSNPSDDIYEEACKFISKTEIISAFPGTGKTYLFNNQYKLNILDSDSSKFSWVLGSKVRNPNFPENYIEHIKKHIGTADIILVSSHKEVRDALVANDIEFTLIYPERDLKEVYLKRFKQRGSPQAFIDLIDREWDNFLEELENQKNCCHEILWENEYVANKVEGFEDNNKL